MSTRTYPEPTGLLGDPLLARHVQPLALRVFGDSPDAVGPSPEALRRLAARGRALHGAALRRAMGGTLRALARLVRHLAAAWRSAALERATRRQLAALDGRLLQDIGLPPERIGELAHALAAARCEPADDRRRARVVRIEALEARRCCAPCPEDVRRAA